MKTTMLVMAAGIGSRFGTGIKQLEPIGDNGEIIIDYSVHDAIRAGINKIVFIIRKDIEADFRERVGNRVEYVCARNNVEVFYAFQDIHDIPVPYVVPDGRTKPWGTCHAVLAAADILNEPFMVINADDYYGQSAFEKMHDWLISTHNNLEIAMAGYELQNTLSDNGSVTRGLCKLDDKRSTVIDIVETRNIARNTSGAIKAKNQILSDDTVVSMNMWGFSGKCGEKPPVLESLRKGLERFLETEMPKDPMKSEFLIPIFIGDMLKRNLCSVSVLETKDKWFGFTYKEDIPFVIANIQNLIKLGQYSSDLYSDL